MSVLGRLEIMTPTETLSRLAKLRPSHIAFINNDQIWTYRRLADEAERVARAFAARDVRRGDRVVLHMANLPELAASYFACLLTGAIACPLNVRLKAAELRPLLQRLQPSLYIGQAETYANVAGIEPTWTSIVGGVPDNEGEWIASARGTSAAHTVEVDEPAVLLQT